jgi:hypothetical protein
MLRRKVPGMTWQRVGSALWLLAASHFVGYFTSLQAIELAIEAPDIVRPGIAEQLRIQGSPSDTAISGPLTCVITVRHGERIVSSQTLAALSLEQIQAGLTATVVWPQQSPQGRGSISLFARQTAGTSDWHQEISHEIRTPGTFLQDFVETSADSPVVDLTAPMHIAARRNQMVRLLRQPFPRAAALRQAISLRDSLAYYHQNGQFSPDDHWSILPCPITGQPFPLVILQPEIAEAQGCIDYWSETAGELWPQPNAALQQLATRNGTAVVLWPHHGGWQSWAAARSRYSERPQFLEDLPKVLCVDDANIRSAAAAFFLKHQTFWQSFLVETNPKKITLSAWRTTKAPIQSVSQAPRPQQWSELLSGPCAIVLAKPLHQLMARRQHAWLQRLQDWAAPAQCRFPVLSWEKARTFEGNLIVLGPAEMDKIQATAGPINETIHWETRKVRWPTGHSWRAEAIGSAQIFRRLNDKNTSQGGLLFLLNGESDIWPAHHRSLGEAWLQEQVLRVDPATPGQPRLEWQSTSLPAAQPSR